MSIKTSKIFCIIPAYNEEKTILNVIDKVKEYIENIIIVDDCSTDNTYNLAKTRAVTVLRHILNRDQGAALQTGNSYALKQGAEIIVHFDADGQFLAEEINDMIKPIIGGECDITFGSRFLSKKSDIPLIKKYFVFPLAKLVNKIIFNVNFSDPQCGFRAFKSSVSDKIIIEHDGKAHCSEIMQKTLINKLSYKEIPVTVVYNQYGQKLSGGIRIVKDVLLAKLLN
jgi:polyprenyl-phospho-N-acetylgalactosaminyl synthase